MQLRGLYAIAGGNTLHNPCTNVKRSGFIKKWASFLERCGAVFPHDTIDCSTETHLGKTALQSILTRIRHDAQLTNLFKNSGLLYASGIFSIILTFVQQITTANALGAANYGRFAIVLSSGFLATVIVDFRTWELGAKLLAAPMAQHNHQESIRIITWLNTVELVAGLIGALSIFLLAEPIARYLLQAPEISWLIRLYALSIPFRVVVMGILSVLPRLFDHFNWVAMKSVGYALARLVFISGAAWLGLGLVGVVIAAILVEVLHLGVMIVMAFTIRKRYLPGTPVFDFTRPRQFAEARTMLGAFWLNSTLLGIHIYAFIPLMALFTTPAQVGLFRSSMDIAELIDRAVQPLLLVIWPKIITLYAPDQLQIFRHYVRQAAVLLNLIALPLSLAIIIASSTLLPHLLTNEGFADIAAVTTVLVVGYGIYIGQFWTRPVIITTGLLSTQNWLTFGLLIVSFGLLVWLTPLYGALGSAAARAVFFLLSGFSSFLLLQSRLPMFGKSAT
ncbi:hypothetical protein FBR01_20745 [Anaerolineae bacterium CFX8]|nr:hypothetical protein [Anaerolineae bacterium CFX8]